MDKNKPEALPYCRLCFISSSRSMKTITKEVQENFLEIANLRVSEFLLTL